MVAKSKFGVMSIEMQMAFTQDTADQKLEKAKDLMASGEEIDMTTGEVESPEEDDLPEEPKF